VRDRPTDRCAKPCCRLRHVEPRRSGRDCSREPGAPWSPARRLRRRVPAGVPAQPHLTITPVNHLSIKRVNLCNVISQSQLSITPVNHTGQSHVSITRVNLCNVISQSQLSITSVSNKCHPHLSTTPDNHTCQSHLSIKRVNHNSTIIPVSHTCQLHLRVTRVNHNSTIIPVSHTCQSHLLRVTPIDRLEYLSVFEAAMTDVWAERLGPECFDAPTRHAWSKIFGLITSHVSDGFRSSTKISD